MAEETGEGAVMKETESNEENSLKGPQATIAAKKNKKCRYGAQCSFKDKRCPFIHPPEPANTANSTKESVVACTEIKPAKVQADRLVERVNSTAVAVAPTPASHVYRDDEDDERAPHPAVDSSKSEDAKFKKRCMFGARCNRKNCKYQHPPLTSANPKAATSAPKLQTAGEILQQTSLNTTPASLVSSSNGDFYQQQQPMMYAADLELELMEQAQAQRHPANKQHQQRHEVGSHHNKAAATATISSASDEHPSQKIGKNQKQRRGKKEKHEQQQHQPHVGTSEVTRSSHVKDNNSSQVDGKDQQKEVPEKLPLASTTAAPARGKNKRASVGNAGRGKVESLVQTATSTTTAAKKPEDGLAVPSQSEPAAASTEQQLEVPTSRKHATKAKRDHHPKTGPASTNNSNNNHYVADAAVKEQEPTDDSVHVVEPNTSAATHSEHPKKGRTRNKSNNNALLEKDMPAATTEPSTKEARATARNANTGGKAATRNNSSSYKSAPPPASRKGEEHEPVLFTGRTEDEPTAPAGPPAPIFKKGGRHSIPATTSTPPIAAKTKQSAVSQPSVAPPAAPAASVLPPSPSPPPAPATESPSSKGVSFAANVKYAVVSPPPEESTTVTLKGGRLRDKFTELVANGQEQEPQRSTDQIEPANSKGMVESSSTTNGEASSPEGDYQEVSEAEKKRRRLEEMRRQQAAATLKTKQKKKNRHERYLQELEESAEKRKELWVKEIAKEERVSDMIAQLCVAEFCRGCPPHVDLDRKTVLDQSERRDELKIQCQEAYRSLYADDIVCRIVVKDSKQQDLNGRTGAIEFWDSSKGKFYVGLDTKKGKGVLFIHLLPENLEAAAAPANRKKKQSNVVFPIYVDAFFYGNDLTVDLDKELVDDMLRADSVDTFLEYFIKSRDRDDAEAKRLAEERKREEEEARRRRAERRRQEAEMWEQQQRDWAERKERMKQMRREHMKGQREQYRSGQHNSGDCNCDRCRFEHEFVRNFFGNMFFGHVRGGRSSSYFDNSNFFSYGDSDDDESYEDEWDQEWNHMHEDDIATKNEEAAAVLGVSVDATVAEIKRAYRTKARLYHPDSYRPEYHEDGMTKQEAEEHFKKLVDSYDLLLSNFDD